MTLGMGLSLLGCACLIDSPWHAGQWVPSDRCPLLHMDPGPPGGEGRSRKPSRLRQSFSPAAWPKPGSAESWPAATPACDSAGPLGVRSLPPQWREGRAVSWEMPTSGNWAYGGVCPLAGGSSCVGGQCARSRSGTGCGGLSLWGPEGGSRNPRPALGPVGCDPSTGLVRERLWSSGPNTPTRPLSHSANGCPTRSLAVS